MACLYVSPDVTLGAALHLQQQAGAAAPEGLFEKFIRIWIFDSENLAGYVNRL